MGTDLVSLNRQAAFNLGDYIKGESLRLRPYVNGSAWIGHARFLNRLVAEQRRATFVVLAPYLGYSYFAACSTVRAICSETVCSPSTVERATSTRASTVMTVY